MNNKKSEAKFTIQFNRTNPAHLRVVDILNNLERYGKSNYIVDAVLHYERYKEKPEEQRSAVINEKHIEAIVEKILRSREKSDADIIPATTSSVQIEKPEQPDIVVGYEDDFEEALGADGLNAIASALEMFKNK